MFTQLRNLAWALSNYEDIVEIVAAEQQKKRDLEREKRQFNLNLCEKHQQERNRSHFSEHNCDYCKLRASLYQD